jgi:NCAIR mutase (PurE)-related protein
MRGAVCLATLLSVPAIANPPPLRVGLSCDSLVPEFIVIESTGPGALVIRLADLFDACIAAMPKSKRWGARS